MSTYASSQERASAILSMSIFAAITFILVMVGASALYVMGKGGIAAYESITARMGSGSHTTSTANLR